MTSNSASRISKNASALFAGMAFNTGLMLVFVVYLARTAGVEQFGQYTLGRQYFELILSISTTPLGILMSRRIAHDHASFNRCLTSALIIASLFTAACIAALWGLCHVFQYSAETRFVVLAGSASLLPAVIAAVLEAGFVAIEKAHYVMFATAISSVVFTVFGIVVVWQGHNIAIIFAGLFLARTIMMVFYLTKLRRTVDSLRWAFDTTYLVQLGKDVRVIALEVWCSTLNNHLDLILLSIFQNEFTVGVYAAASKIIRMSSMLANSYTRAMFPHLARLGKGSPDMLRRVSEQSVKYMLVFVAPVVMVIFVQADYVIELIYTDRYADAAAVLRILVWVVALRFINPFLGLALVAENRPHKSLQAAVIRLVAYSVLAVGLIPIYGAVGAAWTSLAATVLAFAFYYAWVFSTGESAKSLLMTLARVLLATMLAGGLLFVFRERHVVAFVLISGLAYVVLLFLMRVVSSQELKVVYKLLPRRQAE